MTHCWLCPKLLEGENKTGEHVIPSAIGGHKKVFDFICRSCNSTLGDKWEAEVARQFLWFSSAAAVKSGRGGQHPDFKVQTVTGEKLKLRADTVLVLDGHEIDVEDLGDKINIIIRSNDPKTAENLIMKVAHDYPHFDVEKARREISTVDSYLDQPLSMSFTYGGPDAGRSMVKSCLALLSDAGVGPDACGRALAYLKDPSPDASRPFCLFFDADLVVNRPADHLFHCVSVIGQPRERRILGYVEYFNFARILVHIGAGYEGEAFQATYAIDPVEARDLDLVVDFGRIQGRLENLFVMPKEAPQMYLEALQRTGSLVSAISQDRVRAIAVSNASTDALEEIGLDPFSEAVAPDLKEEWMRRFLHNLRPYIESQLAKKRF